MDKDQSGLNTNDKLERIFSEPDDLDLLRTATANIPGFIFQFYARENQEYGFYFLSASAEEMLGLRYDDPHLCGLSA